MRSTKEIKDKKLELFEQRERFSKICSKEKEPNDNLASAFYIVERIYSEKIDMLDWVLNGDTKKRGSKLFKFKNCAESGTCGQYPNCDLCDKHDK